MIWNKHSELEGRHAFLSPSKFYWMNDDEDGLFKRRVSSYSTEIGTLLHEVARKRIKHGFRLGRGEKKAVAIELLEHNIPSRILDAIPYDDIFNNLMAYVNDSVAFKMTPEVRLYYSEECFGTTDAIRYFDADRFLRIHDYKSGTIQAHMEQLMGYAALFCFDRNVKPEEMTGAELRIYQNGEVLCHKPEARDIRNMMDKIIAFDKFLSENEISDRSLV